MLNLFSASGSQNIAIVNKAKTPLGLDLRALVAVHQKVVDTIFGPIWDKHAKLTIAAATPANMPVIEFHDSADGGDFLGYHEMAPNGFPRALIFVEDSIKSGGLCETFGHELFEMLVDPYANDWSEAPNGWMHAKEASDACEDGSFKVDGFNISDFVFPAFFYKPAPAGAQLNYLKTLKVPFQTLPGGYQTVKKGGSITNLFVDQAKARAFAAEDRRLHRSAFRAQHQPIRMFLMTPEEEKGWFDRASGANTG